MIPKEHRDLIIRLLKPGDQLVEEMTASKANINHAIVGLVGEAAAEIEGAVLPMRHMEAWENGDDNWWGDYLSRSDTEWGADTMMPGFDRDNMLEELGDLLFYDGAFKIFSGYEDYVYRSDRYPTNLWYMPDEPSQCVGKGVPRKKVLCALVSSLTVACGRLTDSVKKHVMYAQDLNEVKISETLADINWAISQIAVLCGFTEEEIRQHNIDKLNKRYAEGYSDEAAKARADKEEGVDHG